MLSDYKRLLKYSIISSAAELLLIFCYIINIWISVEKKLVFY